MNNQTVEKLRNMRLGAMAQLHQQYVKENRFEGITCDEYLALLTDHQWEDRENNKIDRLLKQAGFRQSASLGDINYASERNLDKWIYWSIVTPQNRINFRDAYCVYSPYSTAILAHVDPLNTFISSLCWSMLTPLRVVFVT